MSLKIDYSALKRVFSQEYIHLYLSGKTPVIVYQMAKVGSKSVVESLKLFGVSPVFHVHYFFPDTPQTDNPQRQLFSRSGGVLYAYFSKLKRPAKFITLVREPVGRNISAFFEFYSKFTGLPYEKMDLSLEELQQVFFEKYPHQVPLNWFDVEMKKALGIDVYQYSFPLQKGYQTLTANNCELLILKTETDDPIKEQAISEFLELTDFTLTRHNVGGTKKYANAYQKLKKNIELPDSYINQMYESKYTRHFYSNDEIEVFRKKWIRTSSPLSTKDNSTT